MIDAKPRGEEISRVMMIYSFLRMIMSHDDDIVGIHPGRLSERGRFFGRAGEYR